MTKKRTDYTIGTLVSAYVRTREAYGVLVRVPDDTEWEWRLLSGPATHNHGSRWSGIGHENLTNIRVLDVTPDSAIVDPENFAQAEQLLEDMDYFDSPPHIRIVQRLQDSLRKFAAPPPSPPKPEEPAGFGSTATDIDGHRWVRVLESDTATNRWAPEYNVSARSTWCAWDDIDVVSVP